MIEAVLSDSGADRESVTLTETSILFADIVGFTARCESLPPEDVAAFPQPVLFDRRRRHF